MPYAPKQKGRPMATTLALVSPIPEQATPDSATAFARNLVAADPDTAARITAALLASLDASVAAILKASGP